MKTIQHNIFGGEGMKFLYACERGFLWGVSIFAKNQNYSISL